MDTIRKILMIFNSRFWSDEASTSRDRFTIRGYRNGIIIGSIFIFILLVAFLLSCFFDAGYILMIGGIAVGAVVAYGLMILADRKPIQLRCDSCQKIILANTPWICGFCDAKVTNSNDFQFVDRCPKCPNEPKSYICHHYKDTHTKEKCQNQIFLTDDQDPKNPARRLNTGVEKPLPPMPPDPRAVILKGHQERLEDKEHEVAIAKLNARLREIRQDLVSQEDAVVEEKRNQLKRYSAARFAVAEAIRLHKIEASEKYKDDLLRIEQENLSADEWGRDQLGE